MNLLHRLNVTVDCCSNLKIKTYSMLLVSQQLGCLEADDAALDSFDLLT